MLKSLVIEFRQGGWPPPTDVDDNCQGQAGGSGSDPEIDTILDVYADIPLEAAPPKLWGRPYTARAPRHVLYDGGQPFIFSFGASFLICVLLLGFPYHLN